jgi:arsenical pump membrane protein
MLTVIGSVNLRLSSPLEPKTRMQCTPANIAIWLICLAATAGVILRPFRLPEMIWAIAGACALVVFGLLPFRAALHAVGDGYDVYLFLIGMMLLSEAARREGLFDWIATFAVNAARGSPRRLFLIVYIVGTIVTVFLSNDATAVVLTPAVFAATKKAKVEPLPFIFICALIANAASFVLPISNPANLVLYGDRLPPLLAWLVRFSVPSVLSILATYIVLRVIERDGLKAPCERNLEQPRLSIRGWAALGGIGLTAIALLAVSAFDIPLGLPTAMFGVLTLLTVTLLQRSLPWPAIKDVSWSILPLIAGLFVMVEALSQTGVIGWLASALHHAAANSDAGAAAVAGGSIAFASNALNNLPTGLIARSVLNIAHPSQRVTDALLIGVDLGPNLSITGSLATILWLAAIRREGEDVGFWRFLKVGALAMPPALLCALAARLAVN